MFAGLIRRTIGSRNDRLLRRYRRTAVRRVNELAEDMATRSDDELRALTAEYRQRYADGESLDALLPEAFATVREAAERTLGLRHFDVQLIGGMALHEGKIAEMRTGEGKTLVATLAAYLNALAGDGVHVVTVNDYLAQRDAAWMGQVYEFLGLSVGAIVSVMDPAARQQAYAADITYATNNELGFDYLRDNMALTAEQRVQRGRPFAIIDEVDSILIDEARTPLIISGPAEDSTELYQQVDKLVPSLSRQHDESEPGDFTVDEKTRQVLLTEQGHERAETLMLETGLLQEGESLYDAAHINLVHHLSAALRAHALFQKDVHYVTQGGEIVIVDEFTGRLMPGRRWSEGLHQAVEAKEGVPIKRENQTLASITFQNYFRLYHKLSGMTGTADTEAFEFRQIYGLEVVSIPTHHPMIRDDLPDQVYLSKRERFDAVVADVADCHERGQPVLVGTPSIETSEYLSGLLKQRGIAHEVLNAKQHAREAEIVARAGEAGSVTIATNMAGRGTDIVLGGNVTARLEATDPATHDQVRAAWQADHARVVELGGLHMIGCERHESRRIDNQLRGRSGRQGDPGSSRFYLSLEDDLMRIFASERVQGWMQKLGLEEGEAIEHRWVTRAIENAQRKVEGRNFDMRKQLLEYDDIANDQRKVIYQQRSELLEEGDIAETVATLLDDVIEGVVGRYLPPGALEEQWDVSGLKEALYGQFNMQLDIEQWLTEDDTLDPDGVTDRVKTTAREAQLRKEALVGQGNMRMLEKELMLRVLDQHWKEHLAAMDHLRQGIHLRGYAQKNPKQEYRRESFALFTEMLEQIKQDFVMTLLRLEVRSEADVAAVHPEEASAQQHQYRHPDAPAATNGAAQGTSGGAAPPAPGAGRRPAARPQHAPTGPAQAPTAGDPFVRPDRKVGRNESCPCGSGRKFKHCHGRLQ